MSSQPRSANTAGSEKCINARQQTAPILKVENLVVDFPGKATDSRVLDGLCLSLNRGEILGLVGESGCGKSVFARTLVRLEHPGKIVSGSIVLDGQDLTKQSPKKMRFFRGRKISLVLQDPKSAMDPVFTMGSQFRDILSIRSNLREVGWRKRAKKNQKKIHELLQTVGIASPEERCRQYPHQWSRGMLQRAQVQMAFSTMPEVEIMDEVTSALDPTITVQVLQLISLLNKRHGTAIIFITHDFSVALEICDRIAVMHKGTIVETQKAHEIVFRPSHPYTKRLVSGISERVGDRFEKSVTAPAVTIRNFSVQFPLKSKTLFSSRSFYAVRDISLDVGRKEIFCLIGESGSGKTTLMNAILGFCPYQEGEMFFEGQLIGQPDDLVHQRLKSKAQVVFQDPVASLSPYLSLEASIMEPLRARGVKKKEREKIAKKLTTEVGLSYSLLQQRPRQASVGQNQRACIARALSTGPDLLFLDEPLSALDAVNQKEIAELLCRLKNRHSLTCFLIAHDLSLVKNIGTTVAVMYLGRIVEKAPVETFFSNACHPYSQVLLSNVLKPGLWKDKRIVLRGEIPTPHEPPSGCVFHPRCPRRLSVCEKRAPLKRNITHEHEVFCHFASP